MRYPALLFLLAASSTHAAMLEISVTEGGRAPEKFVYELNGERQSLDLRDSHRYSAAFKDKTTNREICREAEYRTGMMMALRDVEKVSGSQYKIEIVGQLSTLEDMEVGEALTCGVNQIPSLVNRAFSDTSVLEIDKTKIMVVDRNVTLLLTIRE